MTDDAFLRTILAAPDDLGPRLVYADWLEEHPEPAQRLRGEFVRLQIADTDPDRQLDILFTYSRKWITLEREWMGNDPLLGGLSLGRDEYRWQRGFVEAVSCNASDWVKHGKSIVAKWPIRELRLNGGMDPSKLAKCKTLKGLRKLDLRILMDEKQLENLIVPTSAIWTVKQFEFMCYPGPFATSQGWIESWNAIERLTNDLKDGGIDAVNRTQRTRP